MKIETEEISIPIVKQKKVRLFIKRIDKVHPFVSGNKWYKLKYNLIKAKEKSFKTLLTFGGAYSNHIVATACAAQENGFQSIGIIRGDKHLPLNPTLSFAIKNGMELHYISRGDYRQKNTSEFLDKLIAQFGDFYLLPKGGTNDLAIKGTAEILDANDTQDYICCAVGTGGTIAGIINASDDKQKIIGFPAIKSSDTLQKEIESWTNKQNWKLINDYVCGGYAKVNKELVSFIHQFNLAHNIPLDAVYTGKMMFGILNLIEQDYFQKGISILAIHTGGLQGNKGMNERFGLDLITE